MSINQEEIAAAMIGKTIQHVEMDILGSSICFHFDDRTAIVLEARGDCCSYSWIESIDAPQALYGRVLSVEEIDMPDLGFVRTHKHEPEDKYSTLQYYGLKITTTKGIAVLDYRNDSNGYYGGELVLRKERA
jgi:hypothetical protein